MGDRQNDQEVYVNVSNRTLLRIISLIILTLLLIVALRKVEHALILIFVAFFLALALNAPVAWIASKVPGKRRGSRTIATTISFLAVVLLLLAFIGSIVPPLVSQTSRFISAAPNLVREVQNQKTAVGHFVRTYHLEKQVNAFAAQLAGRLSPISSSAFSGLTAIADSIFSVLVVLVLTFMMLVEGPRWITTIERLLVRPRYSNLAERTGHDMYRVVKSYVNGQVLLAFVAAVLIAPGLFILHISYPVGLMVIIFLAGLIPVFGHTIGAIIVTLVALFHSIPAALIILAYYILYIQIENYLLQPKLQALQTNMSPLLVFVAVVIGVSFGGLLGGLVAIPTAGCIRVALLEYLNYRQNNHA